MAVAMDIARKVCGKVGIDLFFGMGNPTVLHLKPIQSGYMSSPELCAEVLAKVRSVFEDLPGFFKEGGILKFKLDAETVVRMAMVAQAGRIGNCDECAYLAFAYLIAELSVTKVKLVCNPQVHTFVTFMAGGEEYVVDAWAYIGYTNHADPKLRHSVACHAFKDHDSKGVLTGGEVTLVEKDLTGWDAAKRNGFLRNTTRNDGGKLNILTKEIDVMIKDARDTKRISKVLEARESIMDGLPMSVVSEDGPVSDVSMPQATDASGRISSGVADVSMAGSADASGRISSGVADVSMAGSADASGRISSGVADLSMQDSTAGRISTGAPESTS